MRLANSTQGLRHSLTKKAVEVHRKYCLGLDLTARRNQRTDLRGLLQGGLFDRWNGLLPSNEQTSISLWQVALEFR